MSPITQITPTAPILFVTDQKNDKGEPVLFIADKITPPPATPVPRKGAWGNVQKPAAREPAWKQLLRPRPGEPPATGKKKKKKTTAKSKTAASKTKKAPKKKAKKDDVKVEAGETTASGLPAVNHAMTLTALTSLLQMAQGEPKLMPIG